MDRQSATNPLWRHLQRLENLSVVFRQADGRSPRTTTPTQPGRYLPLVQGMLPVWQSETAVAPLEPATMDWPPVETAVSPTPSLLHQPAPTISHQSEPGLSARPTAPSPPMPQPAASSAPKTPDDDPDWPVLQRIVQAHRQKAAEAAQTGAPTVQPAVEDTPKPGEDAPAEFAQPVALDQVWPVERRSVETIARKEATAVAMPPTDSAAQPASSLNPADEATIRAKIAHILPGKPTEAAVEFAPPRRPRPLIASSPRTAPPSFTMQRKEAAMVPTEIGPLPADLWRLLDETPPQPDMSDANVLTDELTTPVAASQGGSATMPPMQGAAAPTRPLAAPVANLAAASPIADEKPDTAMLPPESDPARPWGQAVASSPAALPESLGAPGVDPETAQPTGLIAPSPALLTVTDGLETAEPPIAHTSIAQSVQRQEASLQGPGKAPSIQRAVQTPFPSDEKADEDQAVPAARATSPRLSEIGAVDGAEQVPEAPAMVQRAEELAVADGGFTMPEMAGGDLGERMGGETAVSPTPDQPDLNAIAQQVFRQLRQRLRIEWERERGRAGL